MTGKKIAALIFILSGVAILAAFGVVHLIRGRKPNAGLKIDSTPPSLVFVDNRQEGKTPFDKLFKPGDISVKLIPDSTLSAVGAYQTQIHLAPDVYTVINRDFGASETASAGEVITLQPQSNNQTSLTIITSSPDSASVSINDQPQGLTPLLISPITPGDHKISLSAPGFTTRVVNAKTISGYKLQISAKLASPAEALAKEGPSPTPAPSTKNQVTILDTPTGFLRVRSGPGRNFTEIGQVKPGEKHDLLSTSSDWYLIQVELSATSSGWISSQYAKKN